MTSDHKCLITYKEKEGKERNCVGQEKLSYRPPFKRPRPTLDEGPNTYAAGAAQKFEFLIILRLFVCLVLLL